MLRTAEIDMADSVKPSDIDIFLSDAAWAIRSTYHTVLKDKKFILKCKKDSNKNTRHLFASFYLTLLF